MTAHLHATPLHVGRHYVCLRCMHVFVRAPDSGLTIYQCVFPKIIKHAYSLPCSKAVQSSCVPLLLCIHNVHTTKPIAPTCIAVPSTERGAVRQNPACYATWKAYSAAELACLVLNNDLVLNVQFLQLHVQPAQLQLHLLITLWHV